MSKVPTTETKHPSSFEYQAARTINGNIEFGLNLRSSVAISLQAPGAPNTEFTITHNLGFVPNGVLILGKDQTCDVYDSRRINWTTSQIFLKCTVASVKLVLVVC